MATYEDFEKLDIRAGEIIDVQDFPEVRKPSYKVKVNFGPDIGEKVSSVQATNYKKEELLGKQIIAVVDFPPKNIAGFMSEVLILGVKGEDGELSLVVPSRKAKLGSRLY